MVELDSHSAIHRQHSGFGVANYRLNLEMADPWLAMEVLTELDEANARYFALTLHSPNSRNYLVSLGNPPPPGRHPPNLHSPKT